MIGQPFINQVNVTLVVKGDKVKLFESNLLELPKVDDLPARKIRMTVAENVQIPTM